MEWYYPDGDIVERQALNRIYVQEHPRPFRLVKPVDHVLTITNARTIDTGVWECRSKESVDSFELCVIGETILNATDGSCRDICRLVIFNDHRCCGLALIATKYKTKNISYYVWTIGGLELG